MKICFGDQETLEIQDGLTWISDRDVFQDSEFGKQGKQRVKS